MSHLRLFVRKHSPIERSFDRRAHRSDANEQEKGQKACKMRALLREIRLKRSFKGSLHRRPHFQGRIRVRGLPRGRRRGS